MKEVLIYAASRDTYSAHASAKHTMTAGELARYFEQFAEETPVIISFDNGYTYGRILEDAFEETQIIEEN